MSKAERFWQVVAYCSLLIGAAAIFLSCMCMVELTKQGQRNAKGADVQKEEKAKK